MHRGVVIGGASAVKEGLDTHWTPYVGCGEVDAAAARVAAAGGVVTTGEARRRVGQRPPQGGPFAVSVE